MAYNLEKALVGAFVGFAEEGKTIDAITVAIDAQPDTDPDTNYSSLGCVQQVNFDSDVETDEDYCPNESGLGYTKEVENNIVADYMDFSLKSHSEPVYRLLFGSAAEIVDGTPFIPFESSKREIKGWISITSKSGGQTKFEMLIWGKLTLQEYPGWSKDATKPVLRFQKLDSPLNTATPTNITTIV